VHTRRTSTWPAAITEVTAIAPSRSQFRSPGGLRAIVTHVTTTATTPAAAETQFNTTAARIRLADCPPAPKSDRAGFRGS
jgi:hypothetical protein